MRMPSLNLATPKPDGVVVTARFRSPKSIQSKVCGLVFGDFIIAPGILLEPFMLPRLVEHIQQLKQGYKGGDTYIDRSTIDALRLKLPSFSATLEEAETMPCQILLVWSFGALRQTFHTELGRWRFLSKGSGDKHKAHIQDRLELLSTFLVLQLQDSVKPILSVGVDGVLVDLMSAVGQFCELHLDRGLDVFSISTPFFLHQFLNSWGKGIVSNVLGSEHCLLLIDLDLPPESEGAILLSKDSVDGRKNLIGMLITNSCQFEQERVGFCLAVNFKSLIQDFLRKHRRTYIWKCISQDDVNIVAHRNQIKDLIDGCLDACVALITTPRSWGSGVVISLSPPYILTCSHVVSQVKEISVTIGTCTSRAEVVYSTPVGQIYDLAILSFIPDTSVKKICISSAAPKLCEPVYIVGFPLLKSEKPSVSHGIVSHLTKSGGPMLTSCCLHSGGSGAPLVRSDGSLLGIMTSFVCSSETSARNFPRLSIAASADIFGEYLKTFLEKKDKKILSRLTSNNPEVNKLWNLSSTNFIKCNL